MMVSKLVSSYEHEDSELNASLCEDGSRYEAWQERLFLNLINTIFFSNSKFIILSSPRSCCESPHPPMPPKNKKHPFGCFLFLAEKTFRARKERF